MTRKHERASIMKKIFSNKLSTKYHLIILFTILTLVSCRTDTKVYEFPLVDEDFDEIVYDLELQWEVQSTDSFNERSLIRNLTDDAGKYVGVLETIGTNDYRALFLSLRNKVEFTSDYNKVLSDSKKLESLIRTVCYIYGNEKDYEKIYKDLHKYLDRRNSEEYGSAEYNLRINDNHITVTLHPYYEEKHTYILSKLVIMNHKTYEKYLSLEEESFKVSLNPEELTVSALKDAVNNECEGLSRFLVLGELENIKEVESDSTYLSSSNNEEDERYPKDYHRADLVDSTGRIEVITKIGSLDEKELSKVRTHYITFDPDSMSLLIEFSTSIDE